MRPLPECYVIKAWVDWDRADTSRVTLEKIEVNLKDGIYFHSAGSTSADALASGGGKLYDRVLQLMRTEMGLGLPQCQALAVAVVKTDAEADPKNVALPVRLITMSTEKTSIDLRR